MNSLVLCDCRSERLNEVMGIMDDAFDGGWGEAWTQAQCSSILIMPGVWMTVASCPSPGAPDGAPAGFSIARVIADEAELLLLGVRKGVRRQGIGSALVGRFCRDAAQRGARRVFLEMRDGNDAVTMYRSAGFEQVGRRRDYYRALDGGSHDALTLSRILV